MTKEKIDRGEIPSWVYIALASTIIIAVIVIKKPEWGTAILNGLKSLWNAMRYFGGSTRLFAKNVLKPAAQNILRIQGPEDALDTLSAIVDGLEPNLGSKILQEFLIRVLPSWCEIPIKMIFTGISIAEFAVDPLGKIQSIINILNPYHTNKQDDWEELIDPTPFS